MEKIIERLIKSADELEREIIGYKDGKCSLDTIDGSCQVIRHGLDMLKEALNEQN